MSKPEKRRWTRGRVLYWLRTSHSWIGLWGAALGLLFGVSGVLLNHRSILKIPAAKTQESSIQLAVPSPAPTDAKAMARWLQKELAIESKGRPRIKEEPARPVAWGDRNLTQPAKWEIGFSSTQASARAEYWVGSGMVSVKRGQNNVFATLNNFHKGTGVGVGWVLLADTLAGSIILLSLTGVVLWTQLNRRLLVGAGIATSSLVLTLVLMWGAL